MVKSGVSTNISTKHQCITAMKEYESKSLEVSLRSLLVVEAPNSSLKERARVGGGGCTPAHGLTVLPPVAVERVVQALGLLSSLPPQGQVPFRRAQAKR